ncbi:hypothetical protein CAPTEDRAFT_225475 [Capitella teleta]|uniref:Pyrroline-5-carboxylate reductase n=1 Tax=Capitella teleta TaxID=283909 RepID=R7TMU0_CAPTE|nr:hypothetical protein CAPTEDRAFT_225475 [Capitella teleta]|eukprot:ELT92400.1 hypothetical protein CAPTEDRAFT_225475 [Capitella teleta]
MKVGFIGAGLMAQALCRGFIGSALVRPTQILASDVNRGKLRAMRELGVETTLSNTDVVRDNEIVILAVKPYIVGKVLREVAPMVHKNSLIVSVAAGITLASMENILPPKTRVVRVMPNTPAIVQSGASVYTLGTSANGEDSDLVTEMLNCVGLVEQMPEYLMDAVTGLSGNGPAYGYVIIQALADGGVKMGLNRDQSTRLAAQLLLGSAKMVLETKGHPEALKDQVCSPGGTSAHALHQMEKAGLRSALIDGVEAGTKRSKEIGKEYAYLDLGHKEESDDGNK